MGNTSRPQQGCARVKDHPHLRGEYVTIGPTWATIEGSPPLAWGIHFAFSHNSSSSRITPTCVGNTRRNRQRSGVSEDHPHLRGEYRTSAYVTASEQGSPPLAWGILGNISNSAFAVRITPTCVGNTHRSNPIHLDS